jgi:ApaG protein
MTASSMSRYEFTCSVEPQFLPDHSDVEHGVYAFAYTVTIQNTGTVAAQLISRHWIITDANGHVEQVKGLGVVGQQPLLRPGEGFEYTSWTRLATPRGTMSGSYFCVAEDGERFEAPIPAFLLLAGDTGPVGGGPRVLH